MSDPIYIRLSTQGHPDLEKRVRAYVKRANDRREPLDLSEAIRRGLEKGLTILEQEEPKR